MAFFDLNQQPLPILFLILAVAGALVWYSGTRIVRYIATIAQRTNIGVLIVASRAPLIAEIELVSTSGATLGSRLIVVQEPGFVHHQLSTADVADIDADASALIRIIEGDGVVVPYGSMIDNSTAEAIFVAGQPIAARSGAARAMLVRAVKASER